MTDLRQIILNAREHVARAVDSGLVLLYWSIGHRIRTEVLNEKRAAYGKEIVSAEGRQLAVEFGEGFSDKNLRHMIRFSEVFSEPSILQSLTAKLSWTHFKSIMPPQEFPGPNHLCPCRIPRGRKHQQHTRQLGCGAGSDGKPFGTKVEP